MLHDAGRAGETQVVPEQWLLDARHIDSDIRGAFSASDSEPILPGGWYRNQFWFVPGPSGDIQLCLGIHGQMVFVDRGTRTVAVKLSSWPAPQDPAHLLDTIRAFAAAGRQLAGLPERRSDTDTEAAHPGPSGLVSGR
jgi:CubicO group peptidase (beta-lactamase class C family)